MNAVLGVSKRPDGALGWHGGLPTRIADAWGAEDNPSSPAVPARIVFHQVDFAPATERLFDAVLRLALHGGVVDWSVSPASRYEPRDRIACLGTEDPPLRNCLPRLSPLGIGGLELPDACERFPDADSLAGAFHESMDRWTWVRLRREVDDQLTDPMAAGRALADDVRHAIKPVWEQWKQLLDGDSDLCRRFLDLMLAAAERVSSEYREAHLRVGPRTTSRLAEGTRVSLIAAVTFIEVVPHLKVDAASNLLATLTTGGVDQSCTGHVMALQMNQGKQIYLNPPDFSHEPALVVMAGFPDTPGSAGLTKLKERIASSRSPRLTRPLPGYPVVFPAKEEFDDAASKGLDALKDRFRPIAEALARLLEGGSLT